jgi:hypothetical protein
MATVDHQRGHRATTIDFVSAVRSRLRRSRGDAEKRRPKEEDSTLCESSLSIHSPTPSLTAKTSLSIAGSRLDSTGHCSSKLQVVPRFRAKTCHRTTGSYSQGRTVAIASQQRGESHGSTTGSITRKLAFLGGSTEGSYFLALRYLSRRFGFTFTDTELAAKSGELATSAGLPHPHVMDQSADLALSGAKLVTLDAPSYWDAEDAARLFAAER